MEKIIQQGAEAVLIKRGNEVIKRRVRKGYRLEELDEGIRRRRTKSEPRLLEKAGKVIFTPRVLKVKEREKEIDMEFIDGEKLSDYLDNAKDWKVICEQIGINIGRLHDVDIIHGDLTTSNMIWVSDGGEISYTGAHPPTLNNNGVKKKLLQEESLNAKLSHKSCSEVTANLDNYGNSKGKLYFIDFGLGYGNGRVEDKAVDLHLIKQALEAKHFLHWENYWEEIKRGYLKESKNAGEVLRRLAVVEKRGRYKEQT